MRPSLLFSVSFLSPCFFLYLLGSFEVTVTSVSLPPFVSRRGLSNTNQRLSHNKEFNLTPRMNTVRFTISKVTEVYHCLSVVLTSREGRLEGISRGVIETSAGPLSRQPCDKPLYRNPCLQQRPATPQPTIPTTHLPRLRRPALQHHSFCR